jgi:urease accessory protein
LRVQKAFYPEGPAVCQTLLLHPPAGIAGGDHLRIEALVGRNAHAQLTTPGAGKWYRSAGLLASQHLRFTIDDHGALEWLPQETIVFDGANARMQTSVSLAPSAQFFGWEVLCFGRTASGERFASGQVSLDTRVERAGRPLWIERGSLQGNDALFEGPAGFAGATVCATLIATLPADFAPAPLLAACRQIAPTDAARHGLTALPGLLVARYLGHYSEPARDWLTRLWTVLRPALLRREAMRPRIWNT